MQKLIAKPKAWDMNLVIDAGNTFIKAGIFENNRLIELHVLHDENEFQKKDLKSKAKRIIVSSVRKDFDYKNYFSSSEILVSLNHSTKLPFRNMYKTPETLGMDRLAAAAGAVYLFPQHDCLVIDAGTCITYEFIDKDSNYRGGAISPGIEMRLKSLNTFTGKLPLIERKDDIVLTGGGNG